MAGDAYQGFAMGGLVTPMGFEQTANPAGNKQDAGFVPPLVPPSTIITGDLAELIELWRTLTTCAQRDLLAAARGLAEGRSMIGKQLSGK